MRVYSGHEYDYEEEVLVDEGTSEHHDLIVFNDDVNTFEHVIYTLMEVCSHGREQAEQCTLIIHYKGKCTVKGGAYNELVPMCRSICERGISAEVM